MTKTEPITEKTKARRWFTLMMTAFLVVIAIFVVEGIARSFGYDDMAPGDELRYQDEIVEISQSKATGGIPHES